MKDEVKDEMRNLETEIKALAAKIYKNAAELESLPTGERDNRIFYLASIGLIEAQAALLAELAKGLRSRQERIHQHQVAAVRS